jgi:hypothetical protein
MATELNLTMNETLLWTAVIAVLLPMASLKNEFNAMNKERLRLGRPRYNYFWKECALKKEFMASNGAGSLSIGCLAAAILSAYDFGTVQVVLTSLGVLFLAIMIKKRQEGYNRIRDG